MRSMDTLRERDEDVAAAADIGSTGTGRDSVGSAKSTGSSVRGRGRSRSTSATPAAAAPVPLGRENEELSSHQAPPPLLHRRLASQSMERPEQIEVKSATVRGRPSGNWL